MTNCTEIIGILGVGNLLMGDEGFGVHFIEHLSASPQLPARVKILDGGTAGIMLAGFLEEVDHLYVIDTVNIEGTPGTIHRFKGEELRSRSLGLRMSPHQVGLLEILELCRLRDKAPATVEMITVIPKDVSLGLCLSEPVKERIPEVCRLVRESLARHEIFWEGSLV